MDAGPSFQYPRIRLRARIALFLVIVQSILLLIHWFIYRSWVTFLSVTDPPGVTALQIAVALLSFSFVTASLLAFRIWNPVVRVFYRLAAVWLGAVNFLFLSACVCWSLYFGTTLIGAHPDWRTLAGAVFALGALTTVYGILNARWVRLRRIRVALPNLPESWRGRVAALVSDVHLGHVNGTAFLRRIVAKLQQLKPDIVFLTGDLYDGTMIDATGAARPWRNFGPDLGAYFVTGNHEEFSDPARYLEAVRSSGLRVLQNEKVVVDGLQLVGVPDHASSDAGRFRSTLESLVIDRDRPSILLSHSPRTLNIPEEAGISLQLSGHTHGGQIFPFTWFTRRIFGRYTYGLQRFGEMLVYTTTGAGTWGPPLRVGTHPEIVLIEFA
jgi:predicted MPP superfamily phosphohydrolase